MVEVQAKPGVWVTICSVPDFCDALDYYRIRPEPKLRPWKIGEVPVGAVVRTKDTGSIWLLAGVNNHGLVYVASDEDLRNLHFMLENYVWRYPHETEWKPCGVVE